MLRLLKPLVERYPSLAQFYRTTRDSFDRSQPLKASVHGFSLGGGHPGMITGDYEPEETALARKLLQECGIFINVGAHVGYYCLHALQLNKQVLAFEPIERNIHYLLKNICANNFQHLAEVYPLALSSYSGIIDIWGGGGSTGTGASIVQGFSGNPASYVRKVPVSTLDRIVYPVLGNKKPFIMVDVDGAEYDLLLGAQAVLASEPRPVWFVEIVSTSNQPANVSINPHLFETFDLFFSYGYRAYYADKDLTPISRDLVSSVANRLTDFESPNFIFK
jgi:FkbM family methyltransferase